MSFFDEPEVAYLVERIPVARVVLQDTPMHRWFCQQARATNMPLKEQCRVLDIPWHARKIPAGGSDDTMRGFFGLAVRMPATLFVSTLPEDRETALMWRLVMEAVIACPPSVVAWCAYNTANGLYPHWHDVKQWVTGQTTIAKGTAVHTVVERAAAWQAELQRAEAEQAAQRNVVGMHNGMSLIQHGRDRYAWELNELPLNPYLGQQAARTAAQAYQQAQAAYGLQRQLDNHLQDALYYGRLNPEQYRRERMPIWPAQTNAAAAVNRDPIAYATAFTAPFIVDDMTMTLLSTYEQFRDEGKNMHHCVEQYWPLAKAGRSYIVAMRGPRGKKLATAEFNTDWHLVQAKGPTNSNVIDNDKIMGALRAFGTRMSTMIDDALTPADVIEEQAKLPKPTLTDAVRALLGIDRDQERF